MAVMRRLERSAEEAAQRRFKRVKMRVKNWFRNRNTLPCVACGELLYAGQRTNNRKAISRDGFFYEFIVLSPLFWGCCAASASFFSIIENDINPDPPYQHGGNAGEQAN